MVSSTPLICPDTKNLRVPGREGTQSILAKKNNQMITYGPLLTNLKGLPSLSNFPDPSKGPYFYCKKCYFKNHTSSTELASEIKLC